MGNRSVLVPRNRAATALVMTALLPLAVYAANPNPPAQVNTVVPQKATASASFAVNGAGSVTTRHPASLTRLTPLSEALDIVRHSIAPPLSIIVLWKPLNGAGIYANTPIGIDVAGKLKVGQILNLLTLSLSAGASSKIGYTVDGGVITISTTDTLAAPNLVTRVYDISDLVSPPRGMLSPRWASAWDTPAPPCSAAVTRVTPAAA